MSVQLPDGTYALRRYAPVEDANADDVPTYPPAPDWTGNGHGRLLPDRSWSIHLDPEAWPVSHRDHISTPDGRVLTVVDAYVAPVSPSTALAAVRHVSATCQPTETPPYPSEV